MRHFSKLFCFLLAFTLTGSVSAQLSPGDIAIVSYDADNPDAISFLALAPIPSGTEIKFTDNGWRSSTNSFRANEGIWVVTLSTGVDCGTEVLVNAAGVTNIQGGVLGTVTTGPGGNPAFSSSGDQVLAYQGDEASPTFIAALNNEGPAMWQLDATSAATSALPPGLVNGMTAVALNEVDNVQYDCITESGSKSELLMAINDATKWLGNNSSKQVPAGCLFAPTDCSGGPGGPGGNGDCAELFISEYVEGSGNNKYIEIYNPTPNPVDLAMYELRRYSNGSTNPFTIDLSDGGVLQSGAVMVFRNGSATLFPGGVVSGAINHNGNDAYELFNLATQKTTDIFGVIGDGSTWTAAGGYSTSNKTLRRKASVKQGVTTNPSGTGPSAFTTLATEWDVFDINTVGGLGSHIGDCVALPTCLITGVMVTATSGCDDNDTETQDDDFYLAEVRVSVNNPPSTGSLELSGPNGLLASVPASSASGGEAVFSGVQLPANGLPTLVTASFTAESCSADALASAVFPCSLPDCTPVINELDYNNPGTDDREFVELYNPCSQSINLADYSVIFVNGANGQVYGDFPLPAVMLAPGEFYVICGDGANTPNCDLDVSPNTNLIQNGNPDAVALLFGLAIADAVSYEGSTTNFTEGSGAGLEDPPTPLRGIARFGDGVDTDQNNADFFVQCVTPGEPNAGTPQFCGIPSDFTVANIGCNSFFPNDAVFDNTSGTYYISSTCAHLLGGMDQNTFVGREVCNNAQISARITNVNPSIGYAGVTMRESLDAGARKLSVIRYPSGQKYVEYRPFANGPYQIFWLPSYTLYADYIRITRMGAYFFAEVSFDGNYWITIYQQYIVGMSNCIQSGMVVSSFANGFFTNAIFDDVTITDQGTVAPPAGPVSISSDEPVSFNLFPNPVVNELSVTIGNAPAEEATISIMSLDGRELYRSVHNIDGTIVNVPLSGLNMTAGMYILTVNTGKEVLTKRFVKANR